VGKARLHEQLSAQMLLQHDLQLAERIQHSFLPKAVPTIPGCRFAVRYEAARHIGGDYYDFIRVAEDGIGVSVGDVSGKGVSAALYMAKLSSEMRFHARGSLSPGTVLKRLNRSLAEEMEIGMFVTLALLVLDPSQRRLTIASAGHPPPLVRSAGGSVAELKVPPNLPLGVRDDAAFSEASYALQPGDNVLLYTDGVTEAMDPAGRMFGLKRLRQVVAGGGEHPRELLAAVGGALAEFTAGHPPSDDQAMVCLEVE
jgi:sigma-B regulation protein RsbU (phosphoserine phosphatase)